MDKEKFIEELSAVCKTLDASPYTVFELVEGCNDDSIGAIALKLLDKRESLADLLTAATILGGLMGSKENPYIGAQRASIPTNVFKYVVEIEGELLNSANKKIGLDEYFDKFLRKLYSMQMQDATKVAVATANAAFTVFARNNPSYKLED